MSNRVAMPTVTLEDAQARLPELIEHLRPGEEVIILRGEEPVARLVGAAKPARGSPGRTAWKCGRLSNAAGGSTLPREFYDDLIRPHRKQCREVPRHPQHSDQASPRRGVGRALPLTH